MSATHFEEFEPERLVKSTDRVRDLGEVFTPSNIVDDMLDLLPDMIWQVHPSPTFLEPSVGNGNFVSAVLSRKLSLIDESFGKESLPAGTGVKAAEFHALEALASIYGIDISEDNIIGGTPGHEVACRPRLLKIMKRWHDAILRDSSLEDTDFLKAASWILDHNMVIGNMLPLDANGKPTGREDLSILEYVWHPTTLSVQILRTTMGDVIGEAEEASSDVLSLFGPSPAVEFWSGQAHTIHEAEHHAKTTLTGVKISNSKGAVNG